MEKARNFIKKADYCEFFPINFFYKKLLFANKNKITGSKFFSIPNNGKNNAIGKKLQKCLKIPRVSGSIQVGINSYLFKKISLT